MFGGAWGLCIVPEHPLPQFCGAVLCGAVRCKALNWRSLPSDRVGTVCAARLFLQHAKPRHTVVLQERLGMTILGRPLGGKTLIGSGMLNTMQSSERPQV